MITKIKGGKVISEKEIISANVYFEDGKIIDVTQEKLPFDREIDARGKYVSAGFIDIHTHGGNNYDFAKTEDEIVNAANFHLRHGTTSICPTISAAPFKVMSDAVCEVKKAILNKKLEANIIGAHLEGPYLSKEQCGAQSTDFITEPIEEDYKELITKHGDAIARWTYAPENDTNGEFCRFLRKNNIIASAGHTNAVYDDMCIAIEKGCKLITHLYSCTSTVTRKQGFRSLGVIETAMLCDDLSVEIIADGKHLPPELIKLILKVKGTDKVALITDSLALAGSDITHGFMMDTEFIVEDGVCKLMDRSAFAGSIATADRLIRVMVNEVGVSIAEAVKMMTEVPAKIMGLNKGKLSPKKDADIIIFDDNINILKAFVMGKEILFI